MAEYLDQSHFSNDVCSNNSNNSFQSLDIMPSKLIFDYVGINQTSEWQMILVRNTSYKAIEVTGVTVIGQFKIEESINRVLDPGESFTMRVQYKQTSEDASTGAVIINTTDSKSNIVPIIGGNGSRVLTDRNLFTREEMEAVLLSTVQDMTAGLSGIRQTKGDFLPALAANNPAVLNVTYLERWARWTRTGDYFEGLGYMSMSSVTGHETTDIQLRINMDGMGVVAGTTGAYGKLLQKSYRLEFPISDLGNEASDSVIEIPAGGTWARINITFPKGNTFPLNTSYIKGATVEAPLILKWNWSMHL